MLSSLEKSCSTNDTDAFVFCETTGLLNLVENAAKVSYCPYITTREFLHRHFIIIAILKRSTVCICVEAMCFDTISLHEILLLSIFASIFFLPSKEVRCNKIIKAIRMPPICLYMCVVRMSFAWTECIAVDLRTIVLANQNKMLALFSALL